MASKRKNDMSSESEGDVCESERRPRKKLKIFMKLQQQIRNKTK